VGGGSADAAAALRLLTGLWNIDPAHAGEVAPRIGADVPACLISRTARGTGAGDDLVLVDIPELNGRNVLLVNPRVRLGTAEVFERWDGVDRGPLGDWKAGRNDLEAPARAIVPQIGMVMSWLETQPGAEVVRMSGSGATCFALFDDEAARDRAAAAVPREWWHLATRLR
jgi:4-diphosphocytidyl-2-C-methyl-D-erythritol kinase